MISVPHFSGHGSALAAPPPKNFMAPGLGPAAPLGGIIKDGAGGAALEAAAGPVVAFVGGGFRERRQFTGGLSRTQGPGGFEVADAFFQAAIAAWKVRRIVARQHAEADQAGGHGVRVEGRAVGALKEQRGAVPAEPAFPMGGALVAGEPVHDQWPEAVA